MTSRFLTYILVFAAALLTAPQVCAQATAQSTPYKFDLGVQLGMSGYIGDANGSNIFGHPGFDGELSFRYLPDTRWAIRGVFSTFGLSGTTADIDNVLPGGAVYEFTSQVYDLGARAEFNFLPYGIGESYKRLRRWTPYLTVGIGVAMSSSDGHTSVVPTLPMGAGIKFKLRERLNLGVEFTMTKAFGDKIDGEHLADLNQIKTAFYKSTDWYSRLTIGISYEFGKRCETCHYVD
ncbi:MAG: porin family protein [Muribaculaceae bacterium]|nr:porin family protein [Muribaculaceae bacterium]